jgi:hypothetical protein
MWRVSFTGAARHRHIGAVAGFASVESAAIFEGGIRSAELSKGVYTQLLEY